MSVFFIGSKYTLASLCTTSVCWLQTKGDSRKNVPQTQISGQLCTGDQDLHGIFPYSEQPSVFWFTSSSPSAHSSRKKRKIIYPQPTSAGIRFYFHTQASQKCSLLHFFDVRLLAYLLFFCFGYQKPQPILKTLFQAMYFLNLLPKCNPIFHQNAALL